MKNIRVPISAAVVICTMALAPSAMAQGYRAPGERQAPIQRVVPDLDRLTTGSVMPRAPTSDQIRGPIHDPRTGTMRPGNPSPSVR